jgi:hypothetical protein
LKVNGTIAGLSPTCGMATSTVNVGFGAMENFAMETP